MSSLNDEELTRAKKLMKEGKLEEALQLINEIGKNRALSHDDQISYYILKSSLSVYLFQNMEILKYAEEAHQKSQNLGKSILLLDVYIQMAMALEYRFKFQESFEFLEKTENLLKMLTIEPTTEIIERKALISYVKGFLHYDIGEIDNALKYAQSSLELREKIDAKADIGLSLWQIGWIYFKTDNDLALEYAEQCIEYCEQIEYKILVQKCNMLKGLIYLSKGELDLALESFLLCKTQYDGLQQEAKNKIGAARLFHLFGMVYHEQDDLERAKEHFEKALKIKKEESANFMAVMTLDSLISLTLDQKDLKSAEVYLKDIKRISDQENNKLLNLINSLNSAKLLKLSPLVSNRAKAEEVLKELLEDKVADNEIKIYTLLNLIDLLLLRLRKTSDLKLIEEIQIYITQMYDIAKSQNSYSLLAEAHLFRAKLELVNLELKGAQQFLEQAQHIAEKYGLNQITRRIMIEQDELASEVDNWERLKITKASIAELINLAHVEEQLTRMLRKRFAF